MADRNREGDLVPIFVDGSGRDGTTLAMQLLATSPEIAFDRVYPYEQRYFSYLLRWSRLPEQESWDNSAWNLDNLAQTDALDDVAMGPIPWRDRSLISGAGSQPFWQAALGAAWTEFSTRAREVMRSQLGDAGLPVRYYAQKSAGTWHIQIDDTQLPALRIVALLRDPRDIWQSSVAFHSRRQKRGGTFLPVADHESMDTYLNDFIDRQKTRLAWLGGLSDDDMPVIRYESLITDLPTEAKRLGEWLGVHLDAEAVLRRRDGFEEHITAKSPEASIGRWKDEMSDELVTRFSQAMGAELAEFGFET